MTIWVVAPWGGKGPRAEAAECFWWGQRAPRGGGWEGSGRDRKGRQGWEGDRRDGRGQQEGWKGDRRDGRAAHVDVDVPRLMAHQ